MEARLVAVVVVGRKMWCGTNDFKVDCRRTKVCCCVAGMILIEEDWVGNGDGENGGNTYCLQLIEVDGYSKSFH